MIPPDRRGCTLDTMFTGLVQAVGRIAATTPAASGLCLLVDPLNWPHQPALGDSIAVNGVCLTITAPPSGQPGFLAFDAVPETLAKTTLQTLQPGHRVNLEHAATAATLFGGHMVQGHVDAVGTVEHIQTHPEWRVTFRPPDALLPFLAPKGSICIDGVSLTLAEVSPAGLFSVALIPTTLELTTLADLRVGSKVNLEADMIAKTVVNYLQNFLAHTAIKGGT